MAYVQIAAQSLPESSPQSNSYVTGAFTGSCVQNVYHNAAMHLEVLFNGDETPYKPNLVCPSGAAGVNNNCLCPGSPSGVPYRQQPAQYQSTYMGSLFSPLNPTLFPQPSRAAQTLIQQRSPLPRGQGFRSMDMMPFA